MYDDALARLASQGLLRAIRDRGCVEGLNRGPSASIFISGRAIVDFASNDYLGLGRSGALNEAAARATAECGTGGGASRLISGGTEYHHALETATADFKGTSAALIFNSGYTANTAIIPALMQEGDSIFSDELNHASIIDGCRLSKADTSIYPHCDMGRLRSLLAMRKGSRCLVATDSVFSMDGDIAPLQELVSLCDEYDCLLLIDDAHATGVLGDGFGSLRHFGIAPRPYIIQMGTFSKALGSFGAFVAAEHGIIQWLLNTARGFIFSTALPAGVVAASRQALHLIREDPSYCRNLWYNRKMLVDRLAARSFSAGESGTPIIPLYVGDVERTLACSAFLFERGFYAPAIRPPTVRVSRLRLTVSAVHSEADINALVDALEEWKNG
ncbi:MAG TPA: 8-amino-7-oxononanoate synthase [Dissulfurispiraceae bacterium]|nr:8-amino-7-oxononanoate synthase [Dissulfurispiraceae bacterium]